MKIVTKLNVGDTCFFLTSNTVCKSKVKKIDISVQNSKFFDCEYTVEENPAGTQYRVRFDSREIFESKDKLLESL